MVEWNEPPTTKVAFETLYKKFGYTQKELEKIIEQILLMCPATTQEIAEKLFLSVERTEEIMLATYFFLPPVPRNFADWEITDRGFGYIEHNQIPIPLPVYFRGLSEGIAGNKFVDDVKKEELEQKF